MLNGSVGTLNYTNAAGTTDLGTWSIGPISVSLPILDGGRRVANVEAAQARYTEAVAVYQSKVRQAVREVEDTLLTLASADARKLDATNAAVGYTASFNATQARYQAGSASLPELEDARRIALAAQSALLQLELERATTWVSLYRVLGGGWNANASAKDATASAKTAPQ
jgi:outer membrane protein TolC